MPHVSVYVDADEVLEDLSDNELRNELARRSKSNGGSGNPADYSIPVKAAQDTLDEVSRLMRKMERFDLAFKLDEIRVDFVDN